MLSTQLQNSKLIEDCLLLTFRVLSAILLFIESFSSVGILLLVPVSFLIVNFSTFTNNSLILVLLVQSTHHSSFIKLILSQRASIAGTKSPVSLIAISLAPTLILKLCFFERTSLFLSRLL